MGEKTHQPSEKKLREARRKGQLPRSKLFTSASVTAGGLLGGISFAPESASRLTLWTTKVLSLDNLEPPSAVLTEAVRILGWCALPTLVGATVGSLLSAIVVAGIHLHTEAIVPDFARLNPFEGFKKLFSTKQLLEACKASAAVLLVGWVSWSSVSAAAPLAFRAINHDGGPGLGALLSLLAPLVLKLSGVLLVLGLADFGLARRRHRIELMMSHDELRQEHKSAEGDPHAKAHRKAEQKRLSAGGPTRGVRRATAVVVNPTHIAIAIRYDEHECEAPYIVAKGREEDALKIRREAKTLGIPIIKDVPMARALIHYDVGDEVPEELYQAAAAVLKVAQEEADRRYTYGARLR